MFLVLAAAAVGAFGVTHNLVRDNEHRLLAERAGEVSALLHNTIEASNSSLSLLALLATLPDKDGFELGARALTRSPGSSLQALTERDGAFVVTASVGGPAIVPGETARPDHAALAARALAARQAAADLVSEGTQVRLAFAAAAPAPVPVVVLLVSAIDPSRPVPATPGSAFSEMRGALYASPSPDPARLVLTSEQAVPLRGAARFPFAVGTMQWTLELEARAPLVGEFPAAAPWILLAAGLVAAVLAGAVVQTFARRQEFGDSLVEHRTSELESTREFLERLLVSGPAVVVRTDVSGGEGRISYVSPNVERVLGLSETEVLLAGTLRRYMHPDDLERVGAAGGRLREPSREPEHIEFRVRRGNGPYLWVSSLSVPELDEYGETAGVFSYVTDISERRAAEEALRAAQQAAEVANRSKSEFLSRMSHELRTPLNAVLGFSQLLKMQALTEDQAEAVDQILRGGRHLLDLVDEVLDITRIETGRMLLSAEAVLVSELVSESLDLVRAMAEQREISLRADETGMSVFIFADRQRAKQILLNLLSNALKYNRQRGTVTVTCTAVSETRLRISVADTGPGIRPEQMDRLFAPFDRLDAAQTDVEGTGIGLMLSKNLAEAMDGALTVESVAGRGSTFSVDLPRAEGPVERFERLQPVAPAVAKDEPEPTPRDGPARKVLYIEDNPSNLRLIERILARRTDVEMLSAMQGRFGIELARQHQPTLILLDLHLPDISGEEILRRLCEDPLTSMIPVVILTADATAGQVQRLLSAGAAAYLTKPLDVSKLLSVVDEMLASR